MKNSIALLLGFYLSAICAFGSNPEKGFALLEAGSFEAAQTFFIDYLLEHPGDRTGRICLARATGLSGDADQALVILNELSVEYPGDSEIDLNLAEAFLWKGDYDKAVSAYEILYQQEPARFEVCLGYANALASSKSYDQAHLMINEAIGLKDIDQARISWKYILLGKQDQLKSAYRIPEAFALLDSIQLYFPEDPEARLTSGVLHLMNKNFRKAREVYTALYNDSLYVAEALLGASYANMVLQRWGAGLRNAEAALDILDQAETEEQMDRINLNYINLMGATKHFRATGVWLDSLQTLYPDNPLYQQSRARMLLWQERPEDAAREMDAAVQLQPGSYDALLSYAEILSVQRAYNDALELLEQAVTNSPERREAGEMMRKILTEQHGSISISSKLLRDNGGNESLASNVRYNFRRIHQFRPHLAAGYKAARGTERSIGIHTCSISGGGEWQPGYRVKFSAAAGVSKVTGSEDGLQWLLSASIWHRTRRAHTLNWIFSKEAYDYNADLIRSRISTANLKLEYQKSFPNGTGIYSAFGSTVFSDENVKIWGFASAYHQVNAFFKMGLNYSRAQFTRPGDPDYFSPSSYEAAECFARVQVRDYSIRPFSFFADAGLGIQQTGGQGFQMNYRWETGIGWRSSGGMVLETAFSGSNSVNAEMGGYSYYALSLSLNYGLKKLPFTSKKEKDLDGKTSRN